MERFVLARLGLSLANATAQRYPFRKLPPPADTSSLSLCCPWPDIAAAFDPPYDLSVPPTDGELQILCSMILGDSFAQLLITAPDTIVEQVWKYPPPLIRPPRVVHTSALYFSIL
jgi:hypothetical protein